MPAQHFTTEFFESEITILIIDTVGCLHQYLRPFFEAQNITTIVRTSEELSDLPQIAIESQHVYKILVCISPSFLTPEIESVLETLSLYQNKLSVLLPVISAWRLQISGEIPFTTEVFSAQQQTIRYCNELLPQSAFIFGQDLVLPPGKMSFLDLVCQNIQTGSVFSPTTTITPQSLAGFCKTATIDVLRPQRISTVISGKMRPVSAIIQRVVQSYEGYYFNPVSVQLVTAQEEATIPFSVVTTTIEENIDEVVNWYTRQLPSPENKSFFTTDGCSFTFSNQSDIEEIPLFIQTSSPEVQEDIQIVTQEIHIEPVRSSLIESTPISVSEPAYVPEIKMLHEDTDFNVSSEIQRIFSESRTESKVDRVTTLVKTEKKIKKKSKKKTAFFYGGLAFTGMGMGALLLMVIFLTSVHFLKKSLVHVLAVASAGQTISSSEVITLHRFEKLVSAQTEGYGFLFSLPQLEEAEHMVSVGEKVQAITEHTTASDQAAKTLTLDVLGNNAGNMEQSAQKMVLETLAAHENLSQIQSELHAISFTDNDQIDGITSRFEVQLNDLKKKLLVQQQFQPILSSFLGVTGKKTYAIVLQNNQELRPTGGFIDAVALVTFENGTIISKTIYSSYEVDAKLPGDFVAPTEVTKFLGEKKFFFHDANWDPDFTRTADTIQKFIEKSLNTSLDGVITLDLYGVQNILEATGPLNLPEFNEVITNKNLLERMEFHSEVVLVESEKNQDYRKLFLSKLLDKTMTLNEDKVLPLLSSLQKSFTEQSMLANFFHTEDQQVFQTLGWTGSLLVPRCPTQFTSLPCQLDPFMQVEANVGVNKANYYLKRTIDHTIEVSPNAAVHTRLITFENTAQSNSWPKGPYKNYVRFYLPTTAEKSSIKIDGTLVPDSDVVRSFDKGQMVLGVFLEVPVKTSKQLAIQFTVPFSALPAKSAFSYVFFNHAQPGNGFTPFVLHVKPSPGLLPKLIAPQATVNPSNIVFSKATDETGLYGVQFDQAN